MICIFSQYIKKHGELYLPSDSSSPLLGAVIHLCKSSYAFFLTKSQLLEKFIKTSFYGKYIPLMSRLYSIVLRQDIQTEMCKNFPRDKCRSISEENMIQISNLLQKPFSLKIIFVGSVSIKIRRNLPFAVQSKVKKTASGYHHSPQPLL